MARQVAPARREKVRLPIVANTITRISRSISGVLDRNLLQPPIGAAAQLRFYGGVFVSLAAAATIAYVLGGLFVIFTGLAVR